MISIGDRAVCSSNITAVLLSTLLTEENVKISVKRLVKIRCNYFST